MRKNRPIFVIFLVYLSFLCTTGVVAQDEGNRPNIVFICVDDYNDFAGHLLGHPQTFTPNIDRLAARGTTFTNAHTAVPVCAPSRNTFFTGKSAEHSGLYSNEEYLAAIAPTKQFRSLYNIGGSPLQVETIPGWLKDSGGYYTIGMGKLFHGWARDGYDRDYDQTNPDACSRGLSWSEFRDFSPKDDPRPEPGLAGNFGDGVINISAGRLPDSVETKMLDYKQTSSAIQFLSDYKANPGTYCNRPFFLAVGMYRPHEPFTAPAKYFLPFYQPDLYQLPYDIPFNYPANSFPPNGVIMPEQPDPIYADFDNLSYVGKSMANGLGSHLNFLNFHNTLSTIPVFSDTLSDLQRKQLVGDSRRATVLMAYLACIRYMDAQVGRLLNAIESDPVLAANTVIVLFSDHGFGMGEKKHWFKNGLWETDTRMPLIISDPRASGGKVQHSPASLLDLFPTLCEIADVPLPLKADGTPYPDGRSLKVGLDGSPLPGLRPVISAIRPPERFPISCYPFYSVRTERYHLIRYRVPIGANTCASGIYEDLFELYDIGPNREIDPNEWRNLADLPAYQSIRDWLNSFIPGEVLAGTIQPGIRIEIPDLGCAPLSTSSLIPVEATLNIEGTGLNPADYQVRWTINEQPVSASGNSATLSLDSLPTSWFVNPTELVIKATLENNSGQILSMDHLRLEIGGGLPDPAFQMTLSADKRLTVEPLTEFPQSGLDFSRWDFGDGIVLNERIPAPHRYLAPGVYTVTHTRFYGPDASCAVSSSQALNVDPVGFGSTCETPYPALVQDVSPTAALVQVSPVYNADYYQWRHSIAGHGQPLWSYSTPVFESGSLLSGLNEDTRYTIEVKAFCSGGLSSDWSYAQAVKTERCRKPFNPKATVGSTNAVVTWEPIEEAVGGTAMFLLSPGQPMRQVYAGAGLSSRNITPLTPNKNHRLYMTSVCRDLGGSLTYIGQTYQRVDFKTLPASASREVGLEELPETELTLWPNPSSGVINAISEGTPGLITYRVLSQDGRVLHQSQVEEGRIFGADLSALPSGMYFLEAVESGLSRAFVLSPN